MPYLNGGSNLISIFRGSHASVLESPDFLHSPITRLGKEELRGTDTVETALLLLVPTNAPILDIHNPPWALHSLSSNVSYVVCATLHYPTSNTLCITRSA